MHSSISSQVWAFMCMPSAAVSCHLYTDVALLTISDKCRQGLPAAIHTLIQASCRCSSVSQQTQGITWCSNAAQLQHEQQNTRTTAASTPSSYIMGVT